MDFVSVRIITSDVARLVEFYERVTGVQAVRRTGSPMIRIGRTVMSGRLSGGRRWR